MMVLGLTGSIGMGKSTTAQLFRDAGVQVHDADAAVHALYQSSAVGPVEAAFPGVSQGGIIDRERLRQRVLGDAAALKRLEAIVHPLVTAERKRFVEAAAGRGDALVVLDIPLLFETGLERVVDKVIVVSAPETVQKARVLARPGMTSERLSAILARQVPDTEKRRRADTVIDTGQGIEAARAQVTALLDKLRSGAAYA